MKGVIFAFSIILVTHLGSLLKAQMRTKVLFAIIWSLGLGLALISVAEIHIPIVGVLNTIYDKCCQFMNVPDST